MLRIPNPRAPGYQTQRVPAATIEVPGESSRQPRCPDTASLDLTQPHGSQIEVGRLARSEARFRELKNRSSQRRVGSTPAPGTAGFEIKRAFRPSLRSDPPTGNDSHGDSHGLKKLPDTHQVKEGQMADHPGGGRFATDRELLSVMSQILASGLSHHDTEELLGEALETDGIYPAVAATAGSLEGHQSSPSLAWVWQRPRKGRHGRCSGPPTSSAWPVASSARSTRLWPRAGQTTRSGDPSAAFRIEVPYFHRHIEEWHSRMASARSADALSAAEEKGPRIEDVRPR